MAIETETTQSDGGIEGRVARIEGALPYLATKEDVAALRAELNTLKWGLGLVSVVIPAITYALIRLLG